MSDESHPSRNPDTDDNDESGDPTYIHDTFRLWCDECPFSVELAYTGPDHDHLDADRDWRNLNECVSFDQLAIAEQGDRCPFAHCDGTLSSKLVNRVPDSPVPSDDARSRTHGDYQTHPYFDEDIQTMRTFRDVQTIEWVAQDTFKVQFGRTARIDEFLARALSEFGFVEVGGPASRSNNEVVIRRRGHDR